jgi:hypothetical protein
VVHSTVLVRSPLVFFVVLLEEPDKARWIFDVSRLSGACLDTATGLHQLLVVKSPRKPLHFDLSSFGVGTLGYDDI